MKSISFKAGILALSAAMSIGTAHATPAGGSSSSNVVVGTSTVYAPGYHTPGLPGVAVQATGFSNLVDFAGLEADVGTGGVDSNSVYTVSNPSGIDSDHSTLGVFHFAQVSGANIYFGEWAATADQTAASHTVYYVGDDGGTTTMPSSGTATYSVKGISDYATNGLLSGTFNANFLSGTTGTLTGSIASSTTGYTVNIGTAAISGTAIAGAGATASQSGTTLATGGAVSGRFYGSNAAALAGIVSFANNVRYNTAFGGSRTN